MDETGDSTEQTRLLNSHRNESIVRELENIDSGNQSYSLIRYWDAFSKTPIGECFSDPPVL